MAKKRTSSKNVFTQLLGQNGLKIVLGLVASGSFVIAFGQEKISQWISLPSSSSSSSVCAEQFYKDNEGFNKNIVCDGWKTITIS